MHIPMSIWLVGAQIYFLIFGLEIKESHIIYQVLQILMFREVRINFAL